MILTDGDRSVSYDMTFTFSNKRFPEGENTIIKTDSLIVRDVVLEKSKFNDLLGGLRSGTVVVDSRNILTGCNFVDEDRGSPNDLANSQQRFKINWPCYQFWKDSKFEANDESFKNKLVLQAENELKTHGKAQE